MLHSTKSEIEQICGAGEAGMLSKAEAMKLAAPSELLKAATGVLHLVLGSIKTENSLAEQFPIALEHAMSALSDSLSDKMLVCAALGVLSTKGEVVKYGDAVCLVIVKLCKHNGLHDTIFVTLEQVMQVCSHVLFQTQTRLNSFMFSLLSKSMYAFLQHAFIYSM